MNNLFAAALSVSAVLASAAMSGPGLNRDAPPPSSSARSEASQTYRLTGDLSALFVSGEIVIYTRSSGGSATGGMSGMSGMASSAATANADPGMHVVATTTLIEGRFRVEGELSQIHPVYFHITNGRTKSGAIMGQVKSQIFILEPGDLTMMMDANYDWRVRGPYNDLVVNIWKDSEPYLAAKAQMTALYATASTESGADARGRSAVALQKTMFAIEAAGREKVATTHPDLLARELAITTSFMSHGWEPDAVRGVLKEDPNNVWARSWLARREARRIKLERDRARIAVGDYAMYFDARTLDDESISLWEVCGSRRYVLLEFWASWCGPCRSEIPHMKKAYAAYEAQGFEIFSFTIDKDKAAWAKASREENLPWIDAGFGDASKPKKLYQVTGVPNNYLIDCRTGKVIAKDLRGDDLDRTLKNLFK